MNPKLDVDALRYAELIDREVSEREKKLISAACATIDSGDMTADYALTVMLNIKAGRDLARQLTKKQRLASA